MSNSDCSSEPTRNGDGVRRLIIVCMKAHVVGKEGCRGFFSQHSPPRPDASDYWSIASCLRLFESQTTYCPSSSVQPYVCLP